MATRFLLIDDHALLREGLALALTRVTEQVEVVEAESAEQAVELLRANPPFDLIEVRIQNSFNFTTVVHLIHGA